MPSKKPVGGGINFPVYIVDDDESIRWVITQTVREFSKTIYEFASAEACLRSSKLTGRGIYLLDIDLGGMHGIALAKKIRERCPGSMVIIVTGQSSYKNAIDAIKAGAFEYIVKPFRLDEIELAVRRAAKELERSHDIPAPDPTRFGSEQKIVGKSRVMSRIFTLIAKASASDVNVLVTGETGTGKELIVSEIHQNSGRAPKPFVAINCAALPHDLLESELFGHVKGSFTGAVAGREGKLKSADGGTLFLDEAGDMSLGIQAKLLRFLQDGTFFQVGSEKIQRVDVRLLFATNRDLEAMCSAGEFRSDLFYRMNVLSIHTPPLRERSEDIPLLVHHFLKKYRLDMSLGERSFSDEAMKMLRLYTWPGNIRELQNLIKSLLITCSTSGIEVDDLPEYISRQKNPQDNFDTLSDLVSSAVRGQEGQIYAALMAQVEKSLFLEMLRLTGWNRSETAAKLGINRNTLHTKMIKLGLCKK